MVHVMHTCAAADSKSEVCPSSLCRPSKIGVKPSFPAGVANVQSTFGVAQNEWDFQLYHAGIQCVLQYQQCNHAWPLRMLGFLVLCVMQMLWSCGCPDYLHMSDHIASHCDVAPCEYAA